MNKQKQDWEKKFDEMFPYSGAIIEDNGRSYTFDDIKQFIRNLLKEQNE